MANYFKCVVKLDKVQEDGLVKKVSETYLVDAISHTDAENLVVDNVAPYANGEFEVYAITRASISDVLTSEDSQAEFFYQTTICFITLDEKTAKEKIVKQRILIQAADFDDAIRRAKEEMKQWMSEVVTLEMKLTKYMDYFQHNAS